MEAEYARRYARLERDHWWWRARRTHLRRVLRAHLGQTQELSILDVGCAGGGSQELLAPFGEVHGIDPEPAFATPDHPYGARFHARPFDADFRPDLRFDLIVMLDVLEHLRHPAGALRQARSLLKEQGLLCLTVPAHPTLWTHHDEVNGHHRRYTKGDLAGQLMGAGFGLLDIHHAFHGLAPAKWCVRALERVRKSEGSGADLPPAPINALARAFFAMEAHIPVGLRPPFGTSLVALARPTTKI